MRCPECGSEIENSASLCPACGAKLTATDKTTVTGGQRFIVKHLELLMLIAGIAVLAIGALIIRYVDPDTFKKAQEGSLEHSNAFITLLLFVIVAVIIASVVTAQRGRLPFIRRIAGLNAIDEAVGRATEMGRPILFSTGLHGVTSIPTLQALAVASHVARTAVRYGSRLIMPVCDQTMLPITEETLREVYTSEGRPESYRTEDVPYLTDRQFAYAAGVTGILHRERVAASFLFGTFFAESLILAENGQAVGAIQVAGTPDLLQIPFFIVTCDYTIIGDEYYAATAYLSREPTRLGSLVGQDLGKSLLLALILFGLIWSAVFAKNNPIILWLGG